MNIVSPIIADSTYQGTTLSEYPYHEADEIRTEGTEFVREFFFRTRLYVNATGSVKRLDGDKTEAAGDSILEILLQERTGADRTLRKLLQHNTATGSTLKPRDIYAGFTAVIDHDSWVARAKILVSLYAELPPEDIALAEQQWRLLAEVCFTTDPTLTVAVLKKFIQQIKQKPLNIDIENHIMPIIVGGQNAGKTTLIQRMLGVLGELASGSTPLSALVDDRNVGLFSRPAVFVDDMEMLDDKMIERLKTVITSPTLERRKMYGQGMIDFRQDATFIATSNRRVIELIRDNTGMRRFASLNFRADEDTTTWRQINNTDWLLLWRSVDHRGPDPIKPYRATLAHQHAATTPGGVLRGWIEKLDLSRDDVRGLRSASGFPAKSLLDLYLDDHPEQPGLDARQFCTVMNSCMGKIGPFVDRGRVQGRIVYRITESVR